MEEHGPAEGTQRRPLHTRPLPVTDTDEACLYLPHSESTPDCLFTAILALGKSPVVFISPGQREVPRNPAGMFRVTSWGFKASLNQITFVATGPLTCIYTKRSYYPRNYYYSPKTSRDLLLFCLTFPLSPVENVFADKIMKHWLSSQSLCYLSSDKDVRRFEGR